MNVEGRFKKIILLFSLVWFCLPAETRPVMVELFVSDSQCDDCQTAMKEIVQLSGEFTDYEFHLLIYHVGINDKLWNFDSAVRAIHYGLQVDRLPVVILNGVSRIDGARPGIISTYRDQVLEKLKEETVGKVNGWMRIKANSLIGSATYSLPLSSSGQYNLCYSLTEDQSQEEPSVVRYSKAMIKSVTDLYGVTSMDIDLADPNKVIEVDEIKTHGFWWVENARTYEIIHSIRAINAAPFQWDFDNNGEWDHNDAFIFSFLWGEQSNAADRDQNGRVDQADLLQILGAKP